MELSNAKMFESIMVLQTLRETGKLGYACARNLRKLMDASKEFFDVRETILKKYGTVDENGNYVIESENAEAFRKELDEYAVIVHEVDVFQVEEDVFCSGNLDNQQMFALDWMVKSNDND